MNKNRLSYRLPAFGLVFGLCGFVSAIAAEEAPLFALNEPSSIRVSEWVDDDEYLKMENVIENDDILLVSAGSVDESGRPVARRFAVSSQSFIWRDASRRRSIPVKIFYPSARSGERFPVILFSHGLGGSYDRCSYLGTAWASRGFVAVMLQHPGSDENVWKGKARVLQELKEAYKYSWNGRTRAEDIRFALDRLESLNAEGHRLAAKLDLSRIGVGGYDLGALASLLVAGQTPPDGRSSLADPRIKAVVAMSPPVNRSREGYQAVYAGISAPVFFVSGTDDDGIVGTTKAHQRRIPFDMMSQGSRYLVVFQGADHQIYGGHMLSISFKARSDKKFQAAIVRATSCFWQAHLQENEKSMTTLNGYGLNSMLGGLASVERRLLVTLPEEASNDEKVSDRSVSPNETSAEEKIAVPAFPLTRYYRSISEKYGVSPDLTIQPPDLTSGVL